MPYSPPPVDPGDDSVTQQNDLNQLNLLSTLHYVWGILSLICGCFPIFHVGLGIAIIVSPESLQSNGNEGPPRELGYLFAFGGLVVIAIAWAIGICIILSGKYLSEQRRRVFSIVIAAISCTSFPIGTALGVFTLIVLLRPSVIKLYRS